MEFKITTDLSQIPTVVEFNFEELKAELAPKLALYKELLVTPDTVKTAEKDRTNLNKLRAYIESKRKEIKKACMTPYKAFEAQYEEIVRMIDEPLKSIDKQIKDFEEQERQAKRDRLEAYFMNCMADVDISISFDKILNTKWANKSMKEAALQQEICDRVTTIQEDFRELKQLYDGSPHLTAVINRYMQDYNKGNTLAYAATLVQQEQRRQEQEAQRAAQQAHSAPEQKAIQVCRESPQNAVSEPQELISGTFHVKDTKEKIIALRDFMKQNSIHFEIVKEKE